MTRIPSQSTGRRRITHLALVDPAHRQQLQQLDGWLRASTADGYPTAHSSFDNTGGQRTVTVDDETGQPDPVPITSVEQAAICDTPARHAHRNLWRHITHLETLEHQITALHAQWAPRRHTDNTPPTTLAAPGCARHKALREHPKWRDTHSHAWADVHATGTAAGNLEHPEPLCRWCWEWVRRTGRPPTHTEVAYYVDHGKTPRTSTPPTQRKQDA